MKFWDGSGMQERILTIEDLTRQDWENLTGEELYRKFPAGTSLYDVINLLVQQLSYLSKKSRQLEEALVDKVLLEDNSGVANKS